MALDFPTSPTLNQTYTYGGRTWIWDGTTWKHTGTSMTWRGAWSGATAYVINDVVQSGGNAYIATAAHTNSTPPSANWALLVSKGDTGNTGPAGPQMPLQPRVTSVASGTSLTPDVSTTDLYSITALAADVTINAPSGTPTNGQVLEFRIKDNNTSRTVSFAQGAPGYTLSTGAVVSYATSPSSPVQLIFRYDSVVGNWLLVSRSDELSNALPQSQGDTNEFRINLSRARHFVLSGLTQSCSIWQPLGTQPNAGEVITLRISDNGTKRALTWHSQFRSSLSATLPTQTAGTGKYLFCTFISNPTDSTLELVHKTVFNETPSPTGTPSGTVYPQTVNTARFYPLTRIIRTIDDSNTLGGFGGNLWAIPFVLSNDRTLTDLVLEVKVSEASTNFRLGVYSANTSLYPAALMVGSGELSAATTGIRTASSLATVLPAGLYFAAFLSNSAAGTNRYSTVPASQTLGDAFFGKNALGDTIHTAYIVSQTYGALPATFPGGASFSQLDVHAIYAKFGA